MLKYLLLVFLSLFCCPMLLAQILSNPRGADSISAPKADDDAHRAGSGFLLVNSKKATLSFSPYITARYLNQMGLDENYTDYKGQTKEVDRRNDLQFQKVTLYFKGWVADPKFRYFLYIWTSNANQGQGAQVVVAGNLQYEINKHFDVGVGIGALPTNRSLIGQWPFWLRQDARTMTEEYFRGSFTTGVWVQGEITDGLYYKTMLGNNLSQLGVDAGQMDNGFDTWSTALWWTTNNYGRVLSYGDFEKHEKIATVLGGSYTTSKETRQSQPGANAPENSQIRVSDGTGIFALNAFAPDTQVLSAHYQMAAFNGGIKYNGFSLDAEYFMRRVNDFETAGTIPVSKLFDTGIAIQGSAMLINKTLQLYSTYSYVDGEYGNPWEVTCGLNWFPFKNKFLRVNPEVMLEHYCPVGYNSYPTLVGSNGFIGMLNIEMFY
jgi:hypothetical protein